MWKDPDPTQTSESRRAEQRAESTGAEGPRVILGIETSCDETAAAVVTADGRVLSSIVASQAELHARYGGVVPEVASRRHLELIGPVIREALAEAGVGLGRRSTRIGVTRGPGLIGALLVGLSAAKAIAWSRGIPLVPVDHLQGHVASLYLGPAPVEPPFVCLLASGGHTLLLAVRAARVVRAARHDARRRRRRGVRQGRPAARAPVPGRRRDRRAGPAGRSRGVPVPGGARAGARLLLLRRQDVAPLHGPRPRRRRTRRAARRSRGLVPAGDRPGPHPAAAAGRRGDGHRSDRRRRGRGREHRAPRGPARMLRSRRSRSAPTTPP